MLLKYNCNGTKQNVRINTIKKQLIIFLFVFLYLSENKNPHNENNIINAITGITSFPNVNTILSGVIAGNLPLNVESKTATNIYINEKLNNLFLINN